MFIKLIKGQRATDYITMEAAKTIAQWIRKQYPDSRVYITGSVLKPELIHLGSDIDIVVKGVEDANYSVLIKSVFRKFPSLKVDIRRMEELDSYSQQKVIKKGYLVVNGPLADSARSMMKPSLSTSNEVDQVSVTVTLQ